MEVDDWVDLEGAADGIDIRADLCPAHAHINWRQAGSGEGTGSTNQPAVGIGELGANVQRMGRLRRSGCATYQRQLEEVAAQSGIDRNVARSGCGEIDVGAGAECEVGGSGRRRQRDWRRCWRVQREPA